MLRIALLVACFTNAFAVIPIQVTDCNQSPNKIAQLNSYHVARDPVLIPGNNTVDVEVQVLQPISGDNFRLELSVLKKVLFGWVVVPCFEDPSLNKCMFNLCKILSGEHYNNTNHCPTEVATSSPDFPCACPFQPGTYRLNPTFFIIENLSKALQFLAQGDYKATAKIFDTTTNEEVGCINVQGSTQSSTCSGINCLFGK